MKTTLSILIALSLSSFAMGQGAAKGHTVEQAVQIKHIITKLNQGVKLSDDEATTYKKFREAGASMGGQGMPPMQGMQGGQGMMPPMQGMQGGQGMQGAQGTQGGQGMMGPMLGGQGMQQSGPSAEKLQKIFAEADKDGDGKLSEAEFKAATNALRPQ